MDNSKLYNALLKTQSRLEQEAAEKDKKPGEQPQAEPKMYAEKPKWSIPDSLETGRQSPTLYDSSVSLDLIYNPIPFSNEQLKKRKIIYPSMANKAILNAYRELRIKLRNRAKERNFSVLLSSLSNKAPSIRTSFNLAATFAMDADTSALLVDCNPHAQDLDGLVSVKFDRGITDFVADRHLKVEDIIYPSGVDRLSVIPAGHIAASAVELFSSVRMRELMAELKGRYPDRCIVINAPAFRLSTEARILVRYADQTVFTVPFGEVTPDDIVESVDGLGTDKFAGLIYQE